MVVGFVLIIAQPKTENDILNALRKHKDISEAHPLFGEYDIIAKIEAEAFEEIQRIVQDQVRPLKGVTETKLLAGIDL